MTRRNQAFVVAVAILVTVMVSGCRTARRVAAHYPKSDLDTIYAGVTANPDRNPVVLVHGFAGSTLQRTGDGATVWGTLFTNDSLQPSSPPGLTAFALDIDRLGSPIASSDLVEVADDTHPVALLEKIEADAGPVEFNISVYAALVGLIESSGYSPCQSNPSAIPSLDQPPCLAFFYDWRQDNVGNAIRLGHFLAAARERIEQLRRQKGSNQVEPVRFDLIAHSMGGLVARYFLRFGARDVLAAPPDSIPWDGADLIDRLIMISTPNFGSMKVLREMVFGRHYAVVDFEPAMILTWTSPYQMLPRSGHALWLDREGHAVDLDILSTELWRDNGWGPFARGQDKYLTWIFPDESAPEGRQQRMAEFMSAAFERARRFYDVMDRHPQTLCPTELTLFAADVQPTAARVVVLEKGGKRELRFEDVGDLQLKSPGDGSVTRASAVGDERLDGTTTGFPTSPIPWDRQIFLTDMHRTFLGNPTFQNNLLHILLEMPPRRGDRT